MLPSATATPGATGSLAVSGYIGYYSNALPVAAVSLAASGPLGTATAQSDVSGLFELTGLSPDAWQVVPRKRGGQAGAISSLDASYTLQSALGMRTLTASQRVACDVSGNGTVSALDASLILRFVVGLEASLPVADMCGSDWAFEPVPVTAENQYTAMPHVAAGTCQHGMIGFQPLVGPANNQSFQALLFGDCTGNWRPVVGGGGAAAFSEGVVPVAVQVGRVRKTTGNRVWVPISLGAVDPIYAVTLQLTYSPARMRLVAVRTHVGSSSGVVEFREDQPGSAQIALASPDPLQVATGPILAAYFAPLKQPWTAAVTAVEASSFPE